MYDEDTETTLLVKKPISPMGGYADSIRDIIDDYSLGAVVQILGVICEERAKHWAPPHVTESFVTRQNVKQWSFAERRLKRVLKDILECGPDSGCK